MAASSTYEREESVEMVWVWIIVVIIVIALLIWWLLSRRKSAQGGSGGQATVGRHVAASERGAAPAAESPQPVFDQEAHDAPGATEPATADAADAETRAMPAVGADDADRATEGEGMTEAAAAPVEPAAEDTAGEDAGTDAEVAQENHDPRARAAGAPPESAAESAAVDDAELSDTPVEHPAEGEVAGGEVAEGDTGWTDAGPDEGAASDQAGTDHAGTDQVGTDQSDAHEAGSDQHGTDQHGTDQHGTGQTDTGQTDTAGTASDAPPQAGDTSSGADPMTERFGEGAASPRPDGSAPEGHAIKGNADSMLFHTPDSPRYDATSPAVWFKDESAATSAGFAHWDRTKRGGAPAASPAPAADSAPAADDTSLPEPAPAPAVESEARETANSPSDGAIAPSLGEEAVTGGEGAAGEGAAGEGAAGEGAAGEGAAGDGAAGEGAAADRESAAAEEAGQGATLDPMQEQFGAGAASPREDGGAPTERHTIKGNAESMLFHTVDSPHYERTEAEVWFTDEEAAKAAGFKHWDHRKR